MLYLSVEGGQQRQDLEDLAEWLGHEPGLRGLITGQGSVPRPGELGTIVDVLAVAVGSGGAVTVLITSLLSYLSNRGTVDLTVKLRGSKGTVSVDAKRVKDPEALIRAASEVAGLQ